MLPDRVQGGAVNQSKALGALEVDKKADLIVLDTMRAYLIPAGRILSAIVHCGSASDVGSVY